MIIIILNKEGKFFYNAGKKLWRKIGGNIELLSILHLTYIHLISSETL